MLVIGENNDVEAFNHCSRREYVLWCGIAVNDIREVGVEQYHTIMFGSGLHRYKIFVGGRGDRRFRNNEMPLSCGDGRPARISNIVGRTVCIRFSH